MFDFVNKKNLGIIAWILISTVAVFLIVTNSYHSQKGVAWEGYGRTVISTDANQYIDVVVSDTLERRTRGLSGTPSLESGLGMLFIFDQSGANGFWMKDMKYAIDIFWLDDTYQLIHTQRNVSPDTYPESFGEEVISRYVLETNVGELVDFTKIQIQNSPN